MGELFLPRLAADHEVFALARSDSTSQLLNHRGANNVRGTLEDLSTWSETAANADAVVNLAGMRFIDLVIRHLDKHRPLTVISPASVRNPAHPRSSELRSAEDRLMEFKKDSLVVFRPTMIYGSSGDRKIKHLVKIVAKLPAVPRLIGGAVIQPVLADDVADAVANTLGENGRLEADLGAAAPLHLATSFSNLLVVSAE